VSSVYESTDFGIAGAWLAEYLLASLDAGVIVCDHGGRIVQWNATAAQLVGMREEDLAGRRFADGSWGARRLDGSRLTARDNPVRAVFDTGERSAPEVIGVTRPDGARGWISVSALPVFGPDRQVRAALASLVDVTAQVNLQRTNVETMVWARTTFEHSLSAHLVFDRDGRIRDWNRSLLRLVDCSDIELIDAHLADICDLDLEWVWGELDGERQAIEGRTLIDRGGEQIPVFGFLTLADWPQVGRAVSAQFLAAVPSRH
jgi:PAS domain S-box-containing protein